MEGLLYFEVSIETESTNEETGKIKKVRETYLVLARSVSDAEARVISKFEEIKNMEDYTVKSVKESRIIAVFDK